MRQFVPEISGYQIVLLGSFNPKIFQPEWFARHNLLSQEQVAAADLKIITPQIAQFETEQTIIQATAQKFTAGSKVNAHPLPLRDVVHGAFSLLEHTPVTAMGLNSLMHFPMASEEAWHRVGDRLAPKEPWDSVLEGRAGLQSLSITTARGINLGGWREDAYPGARYTARIEPSLQLKFGVYFETNEHYPAPETAPLKSLLRILAERWEDVPVYASGVADRILGWATTQQ